jgi:hypothetical protein
LAIVPVGGTSAANREQTGNVVRATLEKVERLLSHQSTAFENYPQAEQGCDLLRMISAAICP